MSSNQKKPLEIAENLPVKTYDVDFGGIVNNIVFIRWLEDLRLKIMDTYCPLQLQLAQGIGPVLLQTKIDYKKAVKFTDKPVGRMWAINMTKHQWVVRAEISLEGKVAASAEQKGLFVRLSDGYPTSVPRELYQEYINFEKSTEEIQLSK